MDQLQAGPTQGWVLVLAAMPCVCVDSTQAPRAGWLMRRRIQRSWQLELQRGSVCSTLDLAFGIACLNLDTSRRACVVSIDRRVWWRQRWSGGGGGVEFGLGLGGEEVMRAESASARASARALNKDYSP